MSAAKLAINLSVSGMAGLTTQRNVCQRLPYAKAVLHKDVIIDAAKKQNM